jgi:hypothetical protein
MNASAPGLLRPNFLSTPSWTAIAIVAAAAAAGAAVRFTLSTGSAAPGPVVTSVARALVPPARHPATAAPAAAADTSVPDAAAAFRAHEPADEPMAPTF